MVTVLLPPGVNPIAVNKYLKKRLELRALCFPTDLLLSSPPR